MRDNPYVLVLCTPDQQEVLRAIDYLCPLGRALGKEFAKARPLFCCYAEDLFAPCKSKFSIDGIICQQNEMLPGEDLSDPERVLRWFGIDTTRCSSRYANVSGILYTGEVASVRKDQKYRLPAEIERVNSTRIFEINGLRGKPVVRIDTDDWRERIRVRQ